MKSELAIKRDEWFASLEGRKCSDPSTIGITKSRDKFLRNRLELAFLAGAIASDQVMQDICDKVIDAITT